MTTMRVAARVHWPTPPGCLSAESYWILLDSEPAYYAFARAVRDAYKLQGVKPPKIDRVNVMAQHDADRLLWQVHQSAEQEARRLQGVPAYLAPRWSDWLAGQREPVENTPALEWQHVPDHTEAS
jgi:hypothetical protein